MAFSNASRASSVRPVCPPAPQRASGKVSDNREMTDCLFSHLDSRLVFTGEVTADLHQVYKKRHRRILRVEPDAFLDSCKPGLLLSFEDQGVRERVMRAGQVWT